MSNSKLVNAIQRDFMKKDVPELRTGMRVEIHQNISDDESKSRIQRFRGTIIKTSGKTPLEKTITVRRTSGGFPVEKIYAIHSPSIVNIDVKRQFKVRRANIGFIRNLTGKAARLKEVK